MRMWMFVGLLAVGCGSDGGTVVDGGENATLEDVAASQVDTVSPDAGTADDAGTTPDVGSQDVGVADTPGAPDGGAVADVGAPVLDVTSRTDDTFETLEPDTETPVDVSTVDAGVPDVGSPDAGIICEPACDGVACDVDDGCGGNCACASDLVCFLGQCTTEGGCTTAQDAAVLASVDIGAVVGECAPGCLLAPDKAVCGSECISSKTNLTAACSGCFGGTVACTFDNCTVQCGFGSEEDCLECQADSGCFEAFEACAGVPALGP